MAPVHRTVACLRFHGDDLYPDELTNAFGKQPTKAAKKGDMLLTPKGRERIANSGMWLLNTDDAEPGDLDRQVAALFSGLSEDFDIWRSFAKRYRGNIFTGLFLRRSNEGLSLSPETLAAIGIRGLELDLDIYEGDDDQDDR